MFIFLQYIVFILEVTLDLNYEQVFYAANNAMLPVNRIYEPENPVTAVAMFEDFSSSAGPEISIEVTLSKTVTSANVELYKSMFAPPTYSPKTIVPPPPGSQPNQRSMVVHIRPTVQVITFSQRNVLTLIGSIAGVYPAFMAIAGVICGFNWSRISQGEQDQTAVELK